MKSKYNLLLLLLLLTSPCAGQNPPVASAPDTSEVSDTFPDPDCDATRVADFKSNLAWMDMELPDAVREYHDEKAKNFIDRACEEDELHCGEIKGKIQSTYEYDKEWTIYLSGYVLDEGAGLEEESASFFVLSLYRNKTPWFTDILEDLVGEIQVELNGFEAGDRRVTIWGQAYPYFKEEYGKFRLTIEDEAGIYEFQCRSRE